MVTVLSKMFVNLFDDPHITPARFLDFCMFSHDKMSVNNKDGKYDNDLEVLDAIIELLNKENNDVDTSLHTQVNNTSEVNRFIKGFGKFMKRNNGAISYTLGGDNTDAFLEFYPYKNEEYLTANRATMPMLVARVNTLATRYADQLGAKLAEDLQAFSPGYKKILSVQRKQIGSVDKNRTERNTAFADAQWSLTGVVLRVAAINLRNPEASKKIFPFDMLYPHTAGRPVYLKGELASGETKELMNRTLTADVTVGIKNTCVNASMMVWLAASPGEAAPETGVVIEPNKKVAVTADKLGDVKGTFLMVKNMSDMNKAAYVIGILGIRKEGDKMEGEVKSLHLKIA